MTHAIDDALAYARTLVGARYRWYLSGPILENDQFYACNEPYIPAEIILDPANDLSLVCTGLINLMRRFVRQPIPGTPALPLLDDIPGYDLAHDATLYPGTTGIWFHYLRQQDWLEDPDYDMEYPVGTLLIKCFESVYGDQGHVAIIVGYSGKVPCLANALILHAYAGSGITPAQAESLRIRYVGVTGVQPLTEIDATWEHTGRDHYFTHISRPVYWLLGNSGKN